MASINTQIEKRVRPVVEERVRAFVADLTDELTALVRQAAAEAVSQTLVGAEAPAATAAPARATRRAPTKAKPGGATAKKTRVRRSPKQLADAAKRLRQYVEKNPGQRIEEIAEGMRTDTKELQRPMKSLLSDGAVNRRGERRASRYYPAGAKAAKRTTKRKTAGKKAGGKKTARSKSPRRGKR